MVDADVTFDGSVYEM